VRQTTSADLSNSDVAGCSASISESEVVRACSFQLSSILAPTDIVAFSSRLDPSLDQIVSALLSNSGVPGDSASFSESGVAGYQYCSILVPANIARLSDQFGQSRAPLSIQRAPSVAESISVEFPISRPAGNSASFSPSVGSTGSCYEISSILTQSGNAHLVSQPDSSVVRKVSTEVPISGPAECSASFSDSGLAGGSSYAISSMVAQSGVAALSSQSDSSVAQTISTGIQISGPAASSAWFSDSGIAFGPSFGISGVIARSAMPGDSSALGRSASSISSRLTWLASLAGCAVEVSTNQSWPSPVWADSELWPEVDGDDAQQELESSAGKVTEAVVGSLAVVLGIAGGMVFFRLLRRKRDAPEPSCHEATVEDVSADPSDGFCESLAQGCGSFDEFTDEAFFVSSGAPSWMDKGGR
jgi:hypothetical protein